MNLEDIHTKLQEWAIEADSEGHEDFSASLWTAAECISDILHWDDEGEEE